MGIARPRHRVSHETAIFLTDAEAARLAGHPGRVDAIGVLAGPGFDAARLHAAARGAQVLTGGARGNAEHPEIHAARTTLIPVTAAFAGLALFIAMFVVASTMGLSIQQREREIALLRAVAATPRQIRRMIGWEAAIVGLIGSAAGIWPGALLGVAARPRARAPRHRAAGLHRHRRLDARGRGRRRRRRRGAARRPGRRAARRSRAADRRARRRRGRAAAARPRARRSAACSRSPARCRCSLVSTTARSPDTAAATSEMTAIMLVLAVGFLGPIVGPRRRQAARPAARALAPVGGFLASANLGTATRRFSSASTPIVLSVAMSCTLLFSSTTIDHAVTQQRHAALTGELALTSGGPGLPPAALSDARATPGVRSAVGADVHDARPEPRRRPTTSSPPRSSTAGRPEASTPA